MTQNDTKDLKMIIDSREPKESQITVAQELEDHDIPCEVDGLETGDFVVGDVAIERKTGKDLTSSITDNRIFEQSSRMQNDFRRSIIILEGTPYDQKYGAADNSVAGTQASIAYKKDATIIFTDGLERTALVVRKIAEYVRDGK